MIVPGQRMAIVIATRPVDFRRGHDGLAATVQNELGLDPHSGLTVVFRSKRGDRLKILVWDGSELVLIYKRLESGSFTWPKVQEGVMRLSRAQFEALFEGVQEYPSRESDESFPEEMTVLNPGHPLYGQSFRVLGRSPRRGGDFEPSYEVEYRRGVSLLVPVAAVEYRDLPNARTKLSVDALYYLLNMVDCIHHHENGTRTSLDDTAADPSKTDRRRYRRGSGGGLP